MGKLVGTCVRETPCKTSLAERLVRLSIGMHLGRGYMARDVVRLADLNEDSFGIIAEFPEANFAEAAAIINTAQDVHYHRVHKPRQCEIVGLHVTHKDADKRRATELALNMPGIRPQETIVLGDGDNDIPMFQIEGLLAKIAVGEAAPGLLAVPGTVHEPDFATAIRNYVL